MTHDKHIYMYAGLFQGVQEGASSPPPPLALALAIGFPYIQYGGPPLDLYSPPLKFVPFHFPPLEQILKYTLIHACIGVADIILLYVQWYVECSRIVLHAWYV